MRFTIVAASALALLLSLAPSAAATPTKLWYQLRVVYLGSHSWEVIQKDGGKINGTFKSAFTGKTDTSVLVRFERGGFRVYASDFSGKVTRYETEYFQDWFAGSHAQCKEHTIEKLDHPTGFVGSFGAEPEYRAGRTVFGVVAGAIVRTHIELPAIAPCAGSIRSRPIELINQEGVKKGELPLYLVKEGNISNTAGRVVAMFRIPERERKDVDVRTAGKFGQSSFSFLAHLVVRHPPTYSSKDGSISSYSVDEAWSFSFARCPGTAPC